MVRIRNTSRRDIQEGETLIKPGDAGELPEKRVKDYAHRVRIID